MADELEINASLDFTPDIGKAASASVAGLLADVSSEKKIEHTQTIGTSEEAIVLGEITSPGWAFFKNVDPTNFINLKVATGGAIFAKLLPGEVAMLRLGSGAQAPFAIADTAPCALEYMLVAT